MTQDSPLNLSAPAMVTWQLTRDCNLACLHCCTDSAPGRALPNELTREEAMRLADQIIEARVPKVMLVGGEPTVVPHFFELAERFGRAGIWVKIETNGQNFGPSEAARLKNLPIFSIQISLDGDTQETYGKMRPGGVLERTHRACSSVAGADLPLEITFAPTRINLDEAEAVIARAASFNSFRFNTGMLMRLGTAAKLWDRLEPSRGQYTKFLHMLRRKARDLNGTMELCFRPWSLVRALKSAAAEPPATLLVLPDGKVKVSAALPYLCADLRRQDLTEAWEAFHRAWKNPKILTAMQQMWKEPERTAQANVWTWLDPEAPDMPGTVVSDRLAPKTQALVRLG